MHLPADMAIVGRDREQAELATALTSTRAGYGRAVLLLGEAGMGKSLLADWLVSQAEQAGMQVARGACSAAGMPPLWPWRRGDEACTNNSMSRAERPVLVLLAAAGDRGT